MVSNLCCVPDLPSNLKRRLALWGREEGIPNKMLLLTRWIKPSDGWLVDVHIWAIACVHIRTNELPLLQICVYYKIDFSSNSMKITTPQNGITTTYLVAEQKQNENIHVTLVIQQALYCYKSLRKTTREHCQPILKIANWERFLYANALNCLGSFIEKSVPG